MKLATKVPAGAVAVLFALALVTPVEAATRTGQYNGNGTTTNVHTGLVSLKSLKIVHVSVRGLSNVAYTTNAIQAALGAGTFLNGNKRDSGVAIEGTSFTVTTLDFNEEGVAYHWEADGDE